MIQNPVPECRICFESGGRLFRPCRCNGTQRYIHDTCLEEMRRSSHNWVDRCPTCHHRYQFTEARLFTFLNHKTTIGCISFFIIAATVGILAYFIKYTWILLLGVRLTPGRLISYAIYFIGLVTLLLALFSPQNGGGGDGIFRVLVEMVRAPPVVFEIMGQVFSLGGFGLFVYTVYHHTRIKVAHYSMQLGQQLIEVV